MVDLPVSASGGWSLVLAALGIAVLHTAIGPDHYVPFVALARARNWSRARMLAVTAGCAFGHVASSLVLVGAFAVAGERLGWIRSLEDVRGDAAAWLLIGFGLAYGLWGGLRTLRRRQGIEVHGHGAATHPHVHVHRHAGAGHEHAPDEPTGESTSFWALFLIFVLGPCEPLIPLVLVPAGQGRWALAGLTASVFSVATAATMLVLVALAHAGLRRVPLGPLERWSSALAGAVVTASGVAVLLGA